MLLGIFPQGAKILCLNKYLQVHVYSSFFSKLPKHKAIKCPSIGRFINTLLYIQKWTIVQQQKEMNYQAIKTHEGILNTPY